MHANFPLQLASQHEASFFFFREQCGIGADERTVDKDYWKRKRVPLFKERDDKDIGIRDGT